ncbi:MAG TPA: alpha/beta hydrolase [Gemmataceae bacterium]|jgi:pimeloyl-ACP methyl ester carboxylesterase
MIHRFTLALFCCLVFAAAGRAEESEFDSNGVKIHYYVQGEGEPVLLIHGFAVNAQLQWGVPGIIKTLAKDHRVIALDCRGHGKSGKPTDPEKYGLEMVEDVVRLLNHLKIKKAHVVGYSMGAVITGKLLVSHPDRLLSATLGGGGPIPEGVKLPSFIDDLADSLEKGKGIGPLMAVLTPPGKPKPSAELIDLFNKHLIADNGKALAAVARSWKTLAVRKEKLKANKVPALALIGELDTLKESVTLMKAVTPNLQVVVIPKADHITAFTTPKFIETLTKFLEKHQGKEKGKEKATAGAER